MKFEIVIRKERVGYMLKAYKDEDNEPCEMMHYYDYTKARALEDFKMLLRRKFNLKKCYATLTEV